MGKCSGMLARISRSVLLLTFVAGCTVGPDYQHPQVAVPATYAAAPAAPLPATPGTYWWGAFRDPLLTSLISQALTGNLDVRQAASRVRQAREQQRITGGSAGPQINASTQAAYTKLSENSLPPALADLAGASSGQPSSGSAIGLPGEGFDTFQMGFDASWEIDLFGGQRRSIEAADARMAAAVWSRRDAELTIAAEVANQYLQYRSLQRRIALADKTLASERDQLEFVRVRSAQGLINSLDERRQQSDIEQLGAQNEDLAAQADARLHGLGILLGLQPNALAAELAVAQPGPPPVVDVPVGLPSELLQRRPDIRSAERQLAASTADIGVATADLYPSFSLTGSLQLVSQSLSTILESNSLQENAAGKISLPLFNRGVTQATVRLRQAQADEALLAYRTDVLSALRDVEDALSRLDADRHRVEHLQAAVLADEDAADTTDVRYRNGLIDFIDVLQARQTELNARDSLEQAQSAAAQDAVSLYKALGGGWDDRRDPTQKEPSSGPSS